MDATVAGIAILFAVLVGLSLIVPGLIPSKSMDKMPLIISILVAAFLGLGGLLALVGLNWQGEVISKGWALERLGWLLAAGGFATYAITVSWHYPGSVFSWVVPLALGVGAGLRCWSVALIERGMKESLATRKEGTNE